MEPYLALKRKEHQAIKRYGRNFNAYYQVKEATLEGYMPYDSNYIILEKTKL